MFSCFLVFLRVQLLITVMKLAQLCSALQYLHNHVPVVIHANLRCVCTKALYILHALILLLGKYLGQPRR